MEQELYYMSWEEFEQISKNILEQIKEKSLSIDTIVPILRGGAPLGSILSNNIPGVDSAYIHIRRSTSNDVNAMLGVPILKGITNAEQITGKNVLIVDDMLDKGVTMDFALKEIKKLNPASIHVAVLYNFTKLENEEMFIIGASMAEKKWIVYPWEKEL